MDFLSSLGYALGTGAAFWLASVLLHSALQICSHKDVPRGVNPDIRVRDLTEDDAAKLREYIDHNCRVEGDLRRDVAFDIKRLIEIGSYRGLRHRKGLPVRGQRSKTNARTRKGPRKTMANKKK